MKRKATRKPKPARAKVSVKAKPRPLAALAAAPPPDAIGALVAAGAQALGLALDPGWEAGVKFNLQLILRHAALVEEFRLPDDTEPAPIFHA